MKKYRLFLLSLVFIGTILSSFHNHANGQSSSECKICVVQHGLSGADIPKSVELQIVRSYCDTFLIYKNIHFSIDGFSNFLSRAPPFFS